jgi:hypothetical protein
MARGIVFDKLILTIIADRAPRTQSCTEALCRTSEQFRSDVVAVVIVTGAKRALDL